MTDLASEVRSGWMPSVERVAQRLAVATVTGAVLGLLVGGVGGRLAMFLLAALNPENAGGISDDGFVMGRFTVSGTMNLLVVATALGVLGGGIYLVLRSLMIGPRWFQVLSISGGPAVVVGSMLVHVDGVDFTLLRPASLAIALFVAIPAAYAALLTVVVEPRLSSDETSAGPRRLTRLAPLLLWLPLAPVFILGAVGWGIAEGGRRLSDGRELLSAYPLIAWAARLALTFVFVASLVDLTRDVGALT